MHEDNYDFSDANEAVESFKTLNQNSDEHRKLKANYYFSFMTIFLCGLNMYFGIKAFRTFYGKTMIITSLIIICSLLMIYKNSKLRKTYLIFSVACILLLTGVFYLGFKDKISNESNRLFANSNFSAYLGEPYPLEVNDGFEIVTDRVNFKSNDESFIKMENNNLIFLRNGKGSVTIFDDYGNKTIQDFEYKGIEASGYGLFFYNVQVGETFSIHPVLYPSEANEVLPSVEILNGKDELYEEEEHGFFALKEGILKIKMTHPRLGDKVVDLKIDPMISQINITYNNLTTQDTHDGVKDAVIFADPGDIIALNLDIKPDTWNHTTIEWRMTDSTNTWQDNAKLPKNNDITEHVFEFKDSVTFSVSVGRSLTRQLTIVKRGY